MIPNKNISPENLSFGTLYLGKNTGHFYMGVPQVSLTSSPPPSPTYKSNIKTSHQLINSAKILLLINT